MAQAQTEVNLNLSNANQSVKSQLSPYSFLDYRQINDNNNIGLKVIITDDGNDKYQAQQTAKKIARSQDILGLIGHYTSGITLNTVDIYQQKDLAQISYGSTTKELSNNPQKNFFRVVYSNEEEAEALTKFIEQSNLTDKKIALFYSPGTEYSNRFRIELKAKINNLQQPDINIVKEFDLASDDFSTTSALQELDKLGVNICILLPDGKVTGATDKALDVLKQDNGKHLMLGGNVLGHFQVSQLETTNPLNLIAGTFWHPTADIDSKFNDQTQQLWSNSVNGATAMAYDATLALIKAIKLQNKPTRRGTIKQLTDENFSVDQGATGSVRFNTPKNGDRANFYPTLVRLYRCEDGSNKFVTLSVDDTQASRLACGKA